jgi:hypothetical protein
MIRGFGAALAFTAAVSAADLTVTGDWFKSVTAADLIAGAGSDLPNSQESSVGATVLSINLAPGAWRVKARRNGLWPANMTLWVRRTSDGNGVGSISGGAAYVEVGGAEVELFSGSEDRSNISLQFRVTGLNRTVSPGDYPSSVTFIVQ